MGDNYESINVSKGGANVPDAPGGGPAPSAMKKTASTEPVGNDNYEQVEAAVSKAGGAVTAKTTGGAVTAKTGVGASKMTKTATTKSTEPVDGEGGEGGGDYEVVEAKTYIPEAPPVAPADADSKMITRSSKGKKAGAKKTTTTDGSTKSQKSKSVKEEKKFKRCKRIKLALLIVGIILLTLMAIGIFTFVLIVILHATKDADFIEEFKDLHF